MKMILSDRAFGPLWLLEPEEASLFDLTIAGLHALEAHFGIPQVRGHGMVKCPPSEADAHLLDGTPVRALRDPYRDLLDPAACQLILSRRNLPMRLSLWSHMQEETREGLVVKYMWTVAFYDDPDGMKSLVNTLRNSGLPDAQSQRRHTTVQVKDIVRKPRFPDVEVLQFAVMTSPAEALA